MRWADVHVRGSAVTLPPAVLVADAIADGRYDAEDARGQDYHSITVAPDDWHLADLWSRTAVAALADADLPATDLDLLITAGTFGAGVDGWSAAAYVQREIGMHQGLGLEVRGGSNGGLISLELAAAHLLRDDASTALITAGDLFPLPYFDRWRAERFVFGDGCASVVLSTQGGFARLVASSSYSDPVLEQMHRGDEPIGPFNEAKTYPIDLRERTRVFLEQGLSRDELFERLSAGPRRVVETVLTEAGLELDAVDLLLVPHFGRKLTVLQCLLPIGLRRLERTAWSFARTTGHLGPADQLAALDHVRRVGAVSAGDRVLMLGVGAGFSWSAVLVEIADL